MLKKPLTIANYSTINAGEGDDIITNYSTANIIVKDFYNGNNIIKGNFETNKSLKRAA